MSGDFEVLVEELTAAGRAIAPQAVFRHVQRLNPTFRGYGQQDAHEALRLVLTTLHEELATAVPLAYDPAAAAGAVAAAGDVGVGSRADDDGGTGGGGAEDAPADALLPPPLVRTPLYMQSIVSDVFGGVLRSVVTCSACGRASVTDDRVNDVCLSLRTGGRSGGGAGGGGSRPCWGGQRRMRAWARSVEW
jgi:hypothetical protein